MIVAIENVILASAAKGTEKRCGANLDKFATCEDLPVNGESAASLNKDDSSHDEEQHSIPSNGICEDNSVDGAITENHDGDSSKGEVPTEGIPKNETDDGPSAKDISMTKVSEKNGILTNDSTMASSPFQFSDFVGQPNRPDSPNLSIGKVYTSLFKLFINDLLPLLRKYLYIQLPARKSCLMRTLLPQQLLTMETRLQRKLILCRLEIN